MTEKEIIEIIGKEPEVTSNKWSDWCIKRMHLILSGNTDLTNTDNNENVEEINCKADKSKHELHCGCCNKIISVKYSDYDQTESPCVNLFTWDLKMLNNEYSIYLQNNPDVFKKVKDDLKKISKLAEKTGIDTACFNFSCADGDFYDDLICPNCGEKIEFVRPYLFLKSNLSDVDERDVMNDTENNYHLYKEYKDFVIWFVFPKNKSNLQLYNKLIKLGFK